jgi:predicted dehydrogenase
VETIRVGVIGVGYLGQFHAEKYAKLDGVELVGVVDIDRSRAREIAKRNETAAYYHHGDLFGKVQAVSIAVPTALHYAIAKDCLLQGLDVLVEKPLSGSLEEADELIALAQSGHRVLQVGHLERFSGPMLAVKGLVKNPLFVESHRLGLFTKRGTDVDVVLDLMIHDLDILLSWVDSKVSEIHAVGIPILTHHIDIANARIEFENGCIANLTASRVSREKTRRIRLFQPSGYLSLDFLAQRVSMTKKVLSAQGLPEIVTEEVPVERVDPLEMEIRSFVESVRERKEASVSGRDGRRALDVAHQIVRKIFERVTTFRSWKAFLP